MQGGSEQDEAMWGQSQAAGLVVAGNVEGVSVWIMDEEIGIPHVSMRVNFLNRAE